MGPQSLLKGLGPQCPDLNVWDLIVIAPFECHLNTRLNLLRYSDNHLNTKPRVWYSDDLFNFVSLLYWLKLGINWLMICFREHLENLLLDDWEQCDVCFSYFPNSNTLSLHRMHAHAIRDKAPSSSIQWYNCYLFCIFLSSSLSYRFPQLWLPWIGLGDCLARSLNSTCTTWGLQ